MYKDLIANFKKEIDKIDRCRPASEVVISMATAIQAAIMNADFNKEVIRECKNYVNSKFEINEVK